MGVSSEKKIFCFLINTQSLLRIYFFHEILLAGDYILHKETSTDWLLDAGVGVRLHMCSMENECKLFICITEQQRIVKIRNITEKWSCIQSLGMDIDCCLSGAETGFCTWGCVQRSKVTGHTSHPQLFCRPLCQTSVNSTETFVESPHRSKNKE